MEIIDNSLFPTIGLFLCIFMTWHDVGNKLQTFSSVTDFTIMSSVPLYLSSLDENLYTVHFVEGVLKKNAFMYGFDDSSLDS